MGIRRCGAQTRISFPSLPLPRFLLRLFPEDPAVEHHAVSTGKHQENQAGKHQDIHYDADQADSGDPQQAQDAEQVRGQHIKIVRSSASPGFGKRPVVGGEENDAVYDQGSHEDQASFVRGEPGGDQDVCQDTGSMGQQTGHMVGRRHRVPYRVEEHPGRLRNDVQNQERQFRLPAEEDRDRNNGQHPENRAEMQDAQPPGCALLFFHTPGRRGQIVDPVPQRIRYRFGLLGDAFPVIVIIHGFAAADNMMQFIDINRTEA